MAALSIDIRSYGAASSTDSHGFAQLVLPLVGGLEMEISGRGGRVARGEAAFVETGADHSQISVHTNHAFILDLDQHGMAPQLAERLTARPFLTLAPAANKLVEFLHLSATGGKVANAMLARWVPLLLDTIEAVPARPQSRLSALLATVEADPGGDWSIEAMSTRAGLSASRLHALFREEMDTTPRAWLAELRLQRVREWLGTTNLPIAELAYRAGYADQSALTRAMRRADGTTPAAWRRQVREQK